jgi:hypothetical protein
MYLKITMNLNKAYKKRNIEILLNFLYLDTKFNNEHLITNMVQLFLNRSFKAF